MTLTNRCVRLINKSTLGDRSAQKRFRTSTPTCT